MSIRTERVAGEIQKAIGYLLQTEFQNLSDGLLSVTKVRASPDLRSCRVYVSILGGASSSDKVLQNLEAEAPHIRAGVARAVRLKFAPELHFFIDNTQEEVDKVEAIFRKIHEADKNRPTIIEDVVAVASPSEAESDV